jgi:hypothetical protein
MSASSPACSVRLSAPVESTKQIKSDLEMAKFMLMRLALPCQQRKRMPMFS